MHKKLVCFYFFNFRVL